MKSKSITHILLVSGLLLAALSSARADELPPDSKPLSSILKSVEEQKLGVITEAELDDGMWEVKVCQTEACLELFIDPRSGVEKRRRKTHSQEIPPANAMPLSMIVDSIEAREHGVIKEAEFEHGFWEVELLKEGRKIKQEVDPGTGETRR